MQLIVKNSRTEQTTKSVNGVTMLGAADATGPQRHMHARKDGEETIGQAVAALLEGSEHEGYTRSGLPKSGTLSSMLAQALQSDDSTLLEEVGLFSRESVQAEARL